MSQHQVFENHASATAAQTSSSGAVAGAAYGGQPSDEIDLLELLAFFLKIWRHIAVGALLGIAAGVGFAIALFNANYYTQFPLVMDRDKLIVSEPKKLVESFNNALNVSDNARKIWSAILIQESELRGKLEKARVNAEDLALWQVNLDSEKPEAKRQPPPLRLREAGSLRDFVLDVRLPVKGLTPDAGQRFAAVIREIVHLEEPQLPGFGGILSKYNASNTEVEAKSDKNLPSRRGVVGLRQRLVKARQELLSIEYRLLKIEARRRQLGQNLGEFFAFVGSVDADSKRLQVSAPQVISNSAPLGLSTHDFYEQVGVHGQFERIQRMVTVLLAENSLTSVEASETLVSALEARDEIFKLIPLARREAVTTQEPSSEASTPEKNMIPSLPVLKTVTEVPVLRALAVPKNDPKFEKPSSRRSTPIVLGGFLGAFVGFAWGALGIFWKKNAKRLREELSR